VGPRDSLDGCGISRPTGIRSPDHPARSESLYRLSYPGPIMEEVLLSISDETYKNLNVYTAGKKLGYLLLSETVLSMSTIF
jgi:hypothetical protein